MSLSMDIQEKGMKGQPGEFGIGLVSQACVPVCGLGGGLLRA